MGGQGLEVGADLIGHISCPGGAVGADDDQVHHPLLHQMPPCIVGDQSAFDPFLLQLPGGEFGPLVPGPGLVHPDMDGDARIACCVDWGGGAAPVHKGQPAGIAVGEDIDRCPIFFLADGPDYLPTMLAQAATESGVLVGNGTGHGKGHLLFIFFP